MMSPMSLVQWLNNLRLLGIDGRVDQLYIGERIQAGIFEWWKIRIHGVSNSDSIFFAIAIRLAILLQVSSCDVERGFSQWVAILNACGKQMKKTLIESRMFSQVNNDLLDYFLSKVDKNVLEGSLAQVAIDNEMASDTRDDDDEEATMNDV